MKTWTSERIGHHRWEVEVFDAQVMRRRGQPSATGKRLTWSVVHGTAREGVEPPLTPPLTSEVREHHGHDPPYEAVKRAGEKGEIPLLSCQPLVEPLSLAPKPGGGHTVAFGLAVQIGALILGGVAVLDIDLRLSQSQQLAVQGLELGRPGATRR